MERQITSNTITTLLKYYCRKYYLTNAIIFISLQCKDNIRFCICLEYIFFEKLI